MFKVGSWTYCLTFHVLSTLAKLYRERHSNCYLNKREMEIGESKNDRKTNCKGHIVLYIELVGYTLSIFSLYRFYLVPRYQSGSQPGAIRSRAAQSLYRYWPDRLVDDSNTCGRGRTRPLW